MLGVINNMTLYEFEKSLAGNPISKIYYNTKNQTDYYVCSPIKFELSFYAIKIFHNPNTILLVGEHSNLQIELVKEIYIAKNQCGESVMHIVCDDFINRKTDVSLIIE